MMLIVDESKLSAFGIEAAKGTPVDFQEIVPVDTVEIAVDIDGCADVIGHVVILP